MPQVAKFEAQRTARVRLKLINEQIRDLKQQAELLAIDALKETCQEVFSRWPEVERFSWVQYDGEYNDEGPYHGLNPIRVNDELDETGGYNDLDSNHPRSSDIYTEVNALGEEVLLKALGGYNQVTVTRDGIEVDGWDGY